MDADSIDAAIDAAVARASEAYAAANPKSRLRHEQARAVLPGGNTRSVLHHAPFPLAFAGGRQATLTSLDGRDYTDLLGEYTAGLFGHSPQLIIAALHEALEGGISLGGHNDKEAQFAALLCARFGLGRVRLTNSGTEANLMALAAAVNFTGRRGVLVFHGGYHGGLLTFAGNSAVNVPHDFLIGHYNDVAGTRAMIAACAHRLAAILVEPMLGSGGCVPGEPAFLAMLREEATRAGALLIFDEVMTSRLSPHGCQRVLGIEPDLTTLGKYLGGGMSFGAFGGRADVMDQFDPAASGALPHAGTFNNNVLTMSAGIAALTQVLDEGALAALNARGDALREGLNELFAARGVAMTASGAGSLLCIHPVPGPVRGLAELAQADPRLRQLLFLSMIEQGFWIAARGTLALSLPVTDGDCERFTAAVDAFLESYRELLPTAPG